MTKDNTAVEAEVIEIKSVVPSDILQDTIDMYEGRLVEHEEITAKYDQAIIDLGVESERVSVVIEALKAAQ